MVASVRSRPMSSCACEVVESASATSEAQRLAHRAFRSDVMMHKYGTAPRSCRIIPPHPTQGGWSMQTYVLMTKLGPLESGDASERRRKGQAWKRTVEAL